MSRTWAAARPEAVAKAGEYAERIAAKWGLSVPDYLGKLPVGRRNRAAIYNSHALADFMLQCTAWGIRICEIERVPGIGVSDKLLRRYRREVLAHSVGDE